MDEFVNYLHEVFKAFGPIHTRRMFGGHGVFHEGLMFGLVADGVLYLKADTETEGGVFRTRVRAVRVYKERQTHENVILYGPGKNLR